MFPGAVPSKDRARQNLQPLGIAGQAVHLALSFCIRSARQSKPDTNVTLFDQGLVQVLEAAVTGLSTEANVCATHSRRGRTEPAPSSR